jgi:hypothetical protein
MEYIPVDILINIAIFLDLPDVLKLCLSSPNINKNLCSNNLFWVKRLQVDYNFDYYKIFPNREYTPKEVYEYYGMIVLDQISLRDEPENYWPLYLKIKAYQKIDDPNTQFKYVVYHSIYHSDINYYMEKDEAINRIIWLGSYYYHGEDDIELDEFYDVQSIEEYKTKLYNILSDIDDKKFIVYRQKSPPWIMRLSNHRDHRDEIYILLKLD